MAVAPNRPARPLRLWIARNAARAADDDLDPALAACLQLSLAGHEKG